MPGHLRDNTITKTIHTIHAPIHSNKVNMKGWLWRPYDIRGPCGPKASWHLSYRWRKSRKKNPTGDRTRAHWVTGAHVTACSTAVDPSNIHNNIIIHVIYTWNRLQSLYKFSLRSCGLKHTHFFILYRSVSFFRRTMSFFPGQWIKLTRDALERNAKSRGSPDFA